MLSCPTDPGNGGVPANGSTVSGDEVFDCVAPPGNTNDVLFYIEGGPNLIGPTFIGYATPTYVGELFDWDTPSVPDGYYDIYCTGEGISPTVSVVVDN